MKWKERYSEKINEKIHLFLQKTQHTQIDYNNDETKTMI